MKRPLIAGLVVFALVLAAWLFKAGLANLPGTQHSPIQVRGGSIHGQAQGAGWTPCVASDPTIYCANVSVTDHSILLSNNFFTPAAPVPGPMQWAVLFTSLNGSGQNAVWLCSNVECDATDHGADNQHVYIKLDNAQNSKWLKKLPTHLYFHSLNACSTPGPTTYPGEGPCDNIKVARVYVGNLNTYTELTCTKRAKCALSVGIPQ